MTPVEARDKVVRQVARIITQKMGEDNEEAAALVGMGEGDIRERLRCKPEATLREFAHYLGDLTAEDRATLLNPPALTAEAA